MYFVSSRLQLKLLISYSVLLFFQVMLAEKKGGDELFAVKVIKKKKTVENDAVKNVFAEKRVSALASGYPYLTALHSTFQTVVTV